jgi:hypothetical protein
MIVHWKTTYEPPENSPIPIVGTIQLNRGSPEALVATEVHAKRKRPAGQRKLKGIDGSSQDSCGTAWLMCGLVPVAVDTRDSCNLSCASGSLRELARVMESLTALEDALAAANLSTSARA